MHIGPEQFSARLLYQDDFLALKNWRALEQDGQWSVDGSGITGRWLQNSPSLFFHKPIAGDYLWQIRVSRVAPGPADLVRFAQSNHWQDADPLYKYNFNFWLRASAPDGGDFLKTYPSKLGTGWNGMGDDYWHSLFNTVVWNPDSNWVRLRSSPGYHKLCDIQNVVPHLPYDEPHQYSFALQGSRVKAYWDDLLLYDQKVEDMPQAGYIGLCVWLCNVRFDSMRLYQLI